MRPLLLWVLLAVPLLGQDPIIFGGKRSPARSGADGIWLVPNPNLALSSGNLAVSPWSRQGAGATIGANSITFAGTNSNGVEQSYLLSPPTGTWTVSALVYTSSGTKAFRLKCTQRGVVDNYSADLTATTTPTIFSFSKTFSASGSGVGIGILNDSVGVAGTINVSWIQLNEGSTALPYVATTDAQSYPNVISGGVALQRGSTSGDDTSDPTRRGVGLSFDSVDDRISNIPAKSSAWTVVNCSEAHCYGVDSAGGSYVDGKPQAGALEFSLQTAGGYSGLLTVLGQWSRVLTAKEHWKDYFTYIRPNVNKAGGSLP